MSWGLPNLSETLVIGCKMEVTRSRRPRAATGITRGLGVCASHSVLYTQWLLVSHHLRGERRGTDGGQQGVVLEDTLRTTWTPWRRKTGNGHRTQCDKPMSRRASQAGGGRGDRAAILVRHA